MLSFDIMSILYHTTSIDFSSVFSIPHERNIYLYLRPKVPFYCSSYFHNSSSIASLDQLLQTNPALYNSSFDKNEKTASAVVLGWAALRIPKKGTEVSS